MWQAEFESLKRRWVKFACSLSLTIMIGKMPGWSWSRCLFWNLCTFVQSMIRIVGKSVLSWQHDRSNKTPNLPPRQGLSIDSDSCEWDNGGAPNKWIAAKSSKSKNRFGKHKTPRKLPIFHRLQAMSFRLFPLSISLDPKRHPAGKAHTA